MSAAADRPAAPPPGIRAAVQVLETQQIAQVASLGLGDPEVIPLWYGESDVPTPAFIGDAAARALAAGETFYTHKRGIPALREAIARYNAALYGVPVDAARVTVTGSGMAGIMMVMQALVDPGDNVVLVDPVWPNACAAVAIMGGEPRPVSLRFGNDGWALDLDMLFDACDRRTRAVFVNSPGNPTGWMMDRAQQQALLDFCRARGIWLIADEVYARIVYERRAAPSFLEIAGPEDPLIVVNSFSKAWAMTGWRLGWLIHPTALGETFDKLVEYNTSGSPPFLQLAAITALEQGEGFVDSMAAHCRRGRETVGALLTALPRVRYRPPEAAFYAFFAVDGVDNSLDFAKRLVRETGVGLAPGTAFGPAGEGWLRLCFARAPETLELAVERLAPALR